MYILKAEKRDAQLKAKQLRRSGYVPAALYGKHLDETVALQIPQGEAAQFLKTNSVGSRLMLEIDGEKHQTMLKDLTKTPMTGVLEHFSFIALKKDEKVKSVANVILLGRELIQREGTVLQTLSEIKYIALPAHLTDKIEVDISHLKVNENIKVADLDFANNPDIELITTPDSVIVTVTPIRVQTVDTPETEDESEEKTDEESSGETGQ